MMLTRERDPRFTAEQYDAAIEALQDAKTQLEPNGHPCHICHDGGHQAWECGNNPLFAMAICESLAQRADALHETLHWLAGFDIWFGQRSGPARVIVPDREGEAVDVGVPLP